MEAIAIKREKVRCVNCRSVLLIQCCETKNYNSKLEWLINISWHFVTVALMKDRQQLIALRPIFIAIIYYCRYYL